MCVILGILLMMKQIVVIALILFAIFTLIYVFQRHLIYFPDKKEPLPEAFQASDMQVVVIPTKDGLSLRSWYKPAINKQPTVLLFHGNAGHIGYRMPLARTLINEGFGVFLLEYRGYGGNKGNPTEQGLYEDARAALQFLQQQGVKPAQLVVYGESLGTGVATKMAAVHSVCALILQSPFTSLADVGRYHYPWLPIKPRDHFNSLERMHEIHTPVLILHGKRDQIVPYDQGVTLFRQAQQPKSFITFEHGSHNDLWDKAFFEEVVHFIQKYCAPQAESLLLDRSRNK